jgi:hypothetical protein
MLERLVRGLLWLELWRRLLVLLLELAVPLIPAVL